MRCSTASRLLLSSLALAALVAPSSPARALAPAATAPAQAPITQTDLLAMMRALPGVHARYREEKRFALLAAPLVAEGTLHWAPPHRLARRQSSPVQAVVVVDKKTLRFGDEHGQESIDLGTNPVVRVFVDSFLDVFSGDVAALEKVYAIHFTGGEGGDPRAWKLVLRPKHAVVAKAIDRIEIRGREAALSRMEVLEVGGDTTVTTFIEVDVKRKYSAEDIARLFSVR